ERAQIVTDLSLVGPRLPSQIPVDFGQYYTGAVREEEAAKAKLIDRALDAAAILTLLLGAEGLLARGAAGTVVKGAAERLIVGGVEREAVVTAAEGEIAATRGVAAADRALPTALKPLATEVETSAAADADVVLARPVTAADADVVLARPVTAADAD